jgi:peptide/nickel transport system substrate-binding protein
MADGQASPARARRPGRGSLSGLFLVACGGKTEKEQSAQQERVSTTAPATGTRPGETPRKGGSLTFYANEPVGFDPHKNDSAQTHNILSLFHAHLTRYSFGPDKEVNDYTPAPDLAESWEQADQTTYVFKLRPGLRWQAKPPVDGRELTAADVAYTFDRIKKLPATFAASQFFVLDGVEAVDGRTVRFSLREPFAPFMNYLSGNFTWIVPREAVEKFGDLKGIEGAVGAGPWMVESYNAGADITLVRNPNYYRSDAPYIDRMRALFGRGPAAVDAAFKAGETPIVGGLASSVEVERFERLRREVTDVLTYRWARPSGYHMMMRTDKPPLNDARVRKAMALSINQDEWINTVLAATATSSRACTKA